MCIDYIYIYIYMYIDYIYIYIHYYMYYIYIYYNIYIIFITPTALNEIMSSETLRELFWSHHNPLKSQ